MHSASTSGIEHKLTGIKLALKPKHVAASLKETHPWLPSSIIQV